MGNSIAHIFPIYVIKQAHKIGVISMNGEAKEITEFQSMANNLDNDGAAIPKLLAVLYVASCITTCDATRYYLARQFKLIEDNKL